MVKKHNVNEINLKINDFYPFANEQYTGITIQWNSDIGFGEYIIYKPVGSNKWLADSEGMDDNEDKDFIKTLMELFIEKLNIGD